MPINVLKTINVETHTNNGLSLALASAMDKELKIKLSNRKILWEREKKELMQKIRVWFETSEDEHKICLNSNSWNMLGLLVSAHLVIILSFWKFCTHFYSLASGDRTRESYKKSEEVNDITLMAVSSWFIQCAQFAGFKWCMHVD